MTTKITIEGDSKSAQRSLDEVIADMDRGDKSAQNGRRSRGRQ